MSKRALKVSGWALLVALVGVLSVVPLVRPTRFSSELFNFGHVVFFGVVAFGLLRLSKRMLAGKLTRNTHHYWVALVGVGILGLSIEVAQYFGPRDADLGDLLRDVVGGAIALTLLLSFDESARRELGRLGRRPWAMRIFGVTLGALMALPLLLVSVATLSRNAAFPEIASFEKPGESWFRATEDGAWLQIVASEDVRPDWAGGRVARVVFESGPYPGLTFLEPVADWRGYRELVFTVFSPETAAVQLHLRVHDFAHDSDAADSYDDRFNTILTVEPGMNHLSISLEDVERGPVDRRIDMSEIDALALFVAEPTEPITLYFDDLFLQ